MGRSIYLGALGQQQTVHVNSATLGGGSEPRDIWISGGRRQNGAMLAVNLVYVTELK